MTCPGPDPDLCADMTPCAPCPTRAVVDGVEWDYDRELGWVEPEDAPSTETPADVGQWITADNGGTPHAPTGESARTGSLDHLDGGGP